MRNIGWKHRASHRNWLCGLQNYLQEKGGFFQSICAMRHDQACHIVLVKPEVTSLEQRLPVAKLHVLAINIANLFLDQRDTVGD